jgi:hypothetical protein
MEKALNIFLESEVDVKTTERAFLKLIKLLKKQGKTDKMEVWKKNISFNQKTTVDGTFSTINGNSTLCVVGKTQRKSVHLEVPSLR